MLQADMFECLSLGLFPFSENGFIAAEVDISGCDVVKARVLSLVVVVVFECLDLAFEIVGKIVVFAAIRGSSSSDASVRFYLGFVDGTAYHRHGSFSGLPATRLGRQRCSMIRYR